MSVTLSRFYRRLPAWGTCFSGTLTCLLLYRMHTFHPLPDLLYTATTFVLELVLIEMITRLALDVRNGVPRVLLLLVPASLGGIYVAQLYSIWVSGGLIPPIALANREVTGLITFNGIYAVLGGYIAAFTAYAYRHRASAPGHSGRLLLVCLGIASLAYAGMIHRQPLARGIMVARGEAPVSSLVHSMIMYAGMQSQARLSSSELIATRAQFSRHTVYKHGFPEEMTASLPDRPNVIVVFTEGMSARSMGSYGGLHTDLMPNLDRLAGGSLMVSNYYNHTAATFRGLRGQLTSGHQETGGFYDDGHGAGQRDVSNDITAVSRASLPDILRPRKYHSLFFLSQQAHLNNMIETLGFDVTLGRDYLFDKYLRTPQDTQRPRYLTDPQLFNAMLDELESQPHDRRFFAAVYNFQTHAFMDGEKKYGDGKNEVLNRFHTYDRNIGEFVDRFMASRLHENTVLVITSDHSTYPDPPAQLADPDVGGYFVDQIPLMIYWKGVEHRKVDAIGKNSLDFAPTLLSLLGIRNANTLFLGCTLFEECALDRISSMGKDEYYLTRNGLVYAQQNVPEDDLAAFKTGTELITRYKAMDLVIGDAD